MIEQTEHHHGNIAMMCCGPGHWERFRQKTHTECTDKLRSQQALAGKVGDLPTTQKQRDLIDLHLSFLSENCLPPTAID